MERRLSLEDLKQARERHLKELRLLERMSDEQFAAFRRNFSLDSVDPGITRARAIELLRSMIQTNLLLQRAKPART